MWVSEENSSSASKNCFVGVAKIAFVIFWIANKHHFLSVESGELWNWKREINAILTCNSMLLSYLDFFDENSSSAGKNCFVGVAKIGFVIFRIANKHQFLSVESGDLWNWKREINAILTCNSMLLSYLDFFDENSSSAGKNCFVGVAKIGFVIFRIANKHQFLSVEWGDYWKW